MNEQTIKELMQPITAYIQSNQVTYNDIHIVVQNLFPDEDKVRQIATYLQQNVQALKVLSDDRLYERTRQILTNALNNAALEVLYDKKGYEDFEEDETSWDYSDLDDDDFEDYEDDDED